MNGSGPPRRYRAEAVVTCDRDFSIHEPGVVDVEGGRIVWVGPAASAPERPEAARHELAGVLLPGLVDAHCHSPMTLFRGAAEDMPLDRFLQEVLWPREARLTPEDVYWGMRLAAVELLRFGVTTTCEMYFHQEAIVRAVVDSGLRSIVTPGVLDVPGLASWSDLLEEVLAFCEEHRDAHPRVGVGIGAHSAYAIPLEGLQSIGEEARRRDLLIHIHVAETRHEGRGLEEEHGRTVPALLSDLGVLDARVLAAHSVWLTEGDLETYRRRDVGVAHCPGSNAKLASGTARLAELLERGVRVGLGTDGPASNNDLDLWEEMRLAALLARLREEDAAAISAPQALILATRGGAEALGREDLGALEPGRWADMILVRTDDSAFAPRVAERDLVSHLVWSASSRLVSDVWVAGERVVEDGECLTVDHREARQEVERRARRLAEPT